jgi:hypothetical protein
MSVVYYPKVYFFIFVRKLLSVQPFLITDYNLNSLAWKEIWRMVGMLSNLMR